MAAPPNAFEAARALSNLAGALVDDARRIDKLADRIDDRAVRQELKESVRALLNRATEISQLATGLASDSDRAFRSKY